MRNIIRFISLLFPLAAAAQGLPTGTEHTDPSAGYGGKAVFRSHFISYDTRHGAESGDPEQSKFYMPLGQGEKKSMQGNDLFEYKADIPYIWLDRDVYLQVSGLDSYYVFIGDDMVAYGEDSRMPMQFLISDHITDGENTISILHAPGVVPRMEEMTGTGAGAEPQVFLFSQPKVCIEDYRIKFFPDSTGSFGVINVRLALSNSYNSAETYTVGYDIYSPQGKLQYYDMREVTVDGRGRDTVRFREPIYKTNENFWTPDNPALYYGMLTVQRGNRMIEYIPFRVGFGKTELAYGKVLRNGIPLEMKPVIYNAAGDIAAARADLAALKKEGYNTLLPDYPQPGWFYDLCDETGFYVVDNANISPRPTRLGPIPGGDLANDPAWLGRYLKRAESVRSRSVNHTCVIAWSLGSDSGKGYNLYETYIDLKSREPFRPVIYRFAGWEWKFDTASF